MQLLPDGVSGAAYTVSLRDSPNPLFEPLVEKDRVGGTCLLRGCIPAKAWIESGGVYATVAGAEEFGVISSEPEFAWPKALERKQKVVEGLVKGLTGTLEARNVEIR